MLRNLSFARTMSMRVQAVRALKDNFMYLVYDDTSGVVAAVDPAEPDKLVAALDKKCEQIR